MAKLQLIETNRIIPGNNHRQYFNRDGIAELAQSIKGRAAAINADHEWEGLIQPITVRPVKSPIPVTLEHITTQHGDPISSSGEFQIVAGERRYRAHVYGGIGKVKAFIDDGLGVDDLAEEIAMAAENIIREDLNPIEEAHAYSRIMSKANGRGEDGYNAIFNGLGKKRDYVDRRLALLKLRSDFQDLVANGNLPLTYAASMAGLNDYYQSKAMEALNTNPAPTIAWFRIICGDLLAKQNQPSFFAWGEIDAGRMGKIADLDAVQLAKEPPPDPAGGIDVSYKGDIGATLAAELNKWKKAAAGWAVLGKTDKATAAGALAEMVSGIAGLLVNLDQEQEIKQDADKIITVISQRSAGRGVRQSSLYQFANLDKTRTIKAVDHLLSSNKIIRHKSGRGYRYTLAG